MGSCVWYACFCEVLLLITSPALLAATYEELDGGGDFYGDGGGDGWGSSCTAWVNANGTYYDSGAVYWGSVDIYTDQPGWFRYSCQCSAFGSASYADFNGSGSSGSGGGTGVAPCGIASASMSLSSGGVPGSDADSDYDGGCAWQSDLTWFDEFDSVSAECACGAYASVPQGGPNGATGSGYANADVWFN